MSTSDKNDKSEAENTADMIYSCSDRDQLSRYMETQERLAKK